MTMMDTLPAIRDVREVEMAVEGLLVDQLRRERDRFVEVAEANGVNFETADELLFEFDAWAAARDLPTSAHALVAFMDEAYRAGGADPAKLQDIGHAYLMQHSWDERLPIIAAFEYFGAAPRLIDAGRMHLLIWLSAQVGSARRGLPAGKSAGRYDGRARSSRSHISGADPWSPEQRGPASPASVFPGMAMLRDRRRDRRCQDGDEARDARDADA